MTGRELIIFILENNFEDVEFTNVCDIRGVMTVKQAALKWNTGEATIKTLFELKKNPRMEKWRKHLYFRTTKPV